ncbi:MAG: hypothetical protein WKF88_03365 [Ferruginibacter sp.]
MMRNIFLAVTCFTTLAAAAQDPKKQGAIDINSSYKPVLRNAVKINFAGSQLATDTSRPKLTYKIPSQNLFYSYAPISLKPLALNGDTNLYLGNRRFLKIGYGNFATPYFSGGMSFGDGKTGLVNITADYISSKGNIANQDYMQVNGKIAGSYFWPRTELYGSTEINVRNYYLYGYDHALFNFKKDGIRQEFQNISFRAGFKNTGSNALGINYDPHAELSLFSNRDKVNETNALITLPAEKQINEHFTVKAELLADLTFYATRNRIPANISFSNNIIQITPSVNYHNDIITLQAGITPAWNNKKYELLPDIYAEAKLKDKPFSVQAGWVGRLVKNSYKNLTAINPYLVPVFSQRNTKETEFYGGIKTSFAKHFTLSAKAGLVRYNDLPLFINDTASDNKAFLISNEERINNIRVHGAFSYIQQDKLTITAAITVNGYTGLKTNARAWHTIPAEVRGSMRWQAFKAVLIKSDLYFFDGSNYIAKGNIALPMNGGTDLSAGVEVKINNAFSVWGDANNLLNSKYERWHNYPVYGANFLGGIIWKF